MAKGKRTDNETLYKVMLSYTVTRNYSQTARDLGLPITTVKKLVDENKNKPEFVKVCNEKKEEFINTADRIISKGTELLEKRLDTALNNQEELDDLIYEIYTADKEEIKEQQKRSLVQKVMKLQVNSLNEITTAIGTLYDKRRLAENGEEPSKTPEVNINIIDNSNLESAMYED